MLTTQNRSDQTKTPTGRQRIAKGFGYLTLDPSPRLMRMREERKTRSTNWELTVRQAWLSVGAAIRTALQASQNQARSPGQ